jgi:hypothetical protein
MKRYFEGGWFKDIMRQSYNYLPPGEYEEFANLDLGSIQGAISIPKYAYEVLLDYIQKHEIGVLKTDRAEDLKIIHRLIDVIQKNPEEKLSVVQSQSKEKQP